MLTNITTPSLLESFIFPEPVSVDRMAEALSEDQKIGLAARLNGLLADNYLLMLKTHAYHWNVKGKLAKEFQSMSEQIYFQIFESIDEIADRIGELGFDAVGTFREFRETSAVSEARRGLSCKEMANDLLETHRDILMALTESLENAYESRDEMSIDLLLEQQSLHERNVWQLKNFLDRV